MAVVPALSPAGVHARPTVSGSALFGESVAISADGQTVLVGAPDASVTLRNGTSVYFGGEAFLYNNHGNLVQTFTDANPVTFEEYASAISLSPDGNLVLIGAPMAGSSGLAFLYNRGGQLIQTYSPPAGTNRGSGFGWSVSFISGGNATDQGSSDNDTSARPLVIISAIFANSKTPLGTTVGGAGQVYMYDLKGTLLRTYSDPSPTVFESFGLSLATAPDGTVAVGAPNFVTVTPSGQVIDSTGKALLFDPAGNLVSTFSDPTPSFFDHFGWSISFLGSKFPSLEVLVGAPGSGGVGAVFLYDTTGHLQSRIPNRSTDCSEFGNSISTATLSGPVDALVAGAPLCLQGSGEASIFRTDTNTIQRLVDPSPMHGEKFGFSVAWSTDGSRIVIGALFRGNAFVFDTSGNLLLVLQ